MKRQRFPDTPWSLLGRARGGEDGARRAALSTVIEGYLPALRRHLIEGRRLAPSIADDILQQFLTEKFLASDKFLSRADAGRGKFRNLLATSINNFAISYLRNRAAEDARVIELEDIGELPSDEPDQYMAFEREWVKRLVTISLKTFEEECTATGRTDMWLMFRLRTVLPALDGCEPADYACIVQQMGLSTPRQAINLLASGKRAFSRHLREAIGQYVQTDARIDEELADLREICLR